MKVKMSMIDKELRAFGWFFKLFLNTYTEYRLSIKLDFHPKIHTV